MKCALLGSLGLAGIGPILFSLLGVACTDSTSSDNGKQGAGGRSPSDDGGAAGAVSEGGGAGTSEAGCDLPTKFSWSSTAPIISPVSDATHDLVAVKDPSIVRYGDRWHVYASSVSKTGAYNMVYTSFADWSDASTAPFYYLDQTPGLNTYVAAPEVFYFAPQKKWYLVYQSGPPKYSTTDDLANPSSWTAPAPFYATTPSIVNNGWLDFWVICDVEFCHLFFSDNHGRWYKSKTAIGSFPAGFGDPVIVMEDAEAGRLFEASNVYKIKGKNQYLALVEAWDGASDWRRYFRSWTADSLEGPWTPLQDKGTAAFASKYNVTFEGDAWTVDISHGEMIRDGYDQTLTIDPCSPLQFIYQGVAKDFVTDNYNAIPWQLGLLTQK